jgi:5-methylcytosine-specific restriction endonuclease McrA
MTAVSGVSGVLVINAGHEPLHRVSMRHAMRMLVRQVAVVHEAVDGQRFGPYPRPAVLRLVRYVQMRWRRNPPAWTRDGVLRRDGYRCAYCSGPAATVDHVLPRCRGGQDTWQNTVAACGRCNGRKGDRTPAEAGMPLQARPQVPTWHEVVR